MNRRIVIFPFIVMYILSLKITYLYGIKPIKENIITNNCKSIVVLGGRDSFDRILKGLEMMQNKNLEIIVFSGISKKLKKTIGKFDVNNLFFEEESTTTYENAFYTSKILKEKNIDEICLISSETHLYRAKKVFEKFDFIVFPISSNTITMNFIKVKYFFPDFKYLYLNKDLIYEYLAIFYYKIQEKI